MQYPPYVYLCQVADHCPLAMATYLLLWRQHSPCGRILYTREYICDERSMSWVRFVNDLRVLQREGLLEWHRKDARAIEVELAEPEICAFGHALS